MEKTVPSSNLYCGPIFLLVFVDMFSLHPNNPLEFIIVKSIGMLC